MSPPRPGPTASGVELWMVQDCPVTVLLMRHGEPDWGQVQDPRWRGAANDWAPLTPHGQVQAEQAADRLARQHPTLVLSSPMTRALQTAAIVASRLDVPLAVELDLREWLPDETYQWTSAEDVATAYTDMLHRAAPRRTTGQRAGSHSTRYATGPWPHCTGTPTQAPRSSPSATKCSSTPSPGTPKPATARYEPYPSRALTNGSTPTCGLAGSWSRGHRPACDVSVWGCRYSPSFRWAGSLL